MNYATLHVEVEDGVGEIALDRPQYRNAQSRQMLDELDHAFDALDTDGAVRSILLYGQGPAFSAGHDLGTPDERADPRPLPEGVGDTVMHSWRTYTETALRWRRLDKPTIAAIHGATVFAGWMIAAQMDIIIASDDARILPHLSECATLPYDVGARRSRYILLRNRMLNADEAFKQGLVSEVVPTADLLTHARRVARELADNDPYLMRQVKQAHLMFDEMSGLGAYVRGTHQMHMLARFDGAFAMRESEDDGKRATMGPVELAKERNRGE